MRKKRVTLADVAKKAGLSSSAASMILTGRPDTRLSPEAHERVHAAVAELGYRPNISARALRTSKSNTVAFISDKVATTRFASGLIRGALRALNAKDHVLLVLETEGAIEQEAIAFRAALDRQVDGIIFASVRAREAFLPDTPAEVPVIMLNATNKRCPTSVLPDEYAGGQDAVRLLAEAGHRDGIVLLGHNSTEEQGLFRSETVRRRLDGIRAGMAQRGLTFAAERSTWDWEATNGYDLVRALLRDGPTPKALLCLNDRLALGAYQALSDAGLRVPDDVSCVSFDDDEIASYVRPGLTTIALPFEKMGEVAATSLLMPPETAGEILVPMPAMLRGSIGAPAS